HVGFELAHLAQVLAQIDTVKVHLTLPGFLAPAGRSNIVRAGSSRSHYMNRPVRKLIALESRVGRTIPNWHAWKGCRLSALLSSP
ncbi:MAG TPA: hypothetical protein VN754_03085, partial [Candidatus Binataceae bacterium]|nr:hypothetical protein [Candidatus Binataceae bacterium]